MIVFSCPTCRNALQVPPTSAGQAVACPYCRNGVIVPPAALAAPAAPPRLPQPEPLSLDDPEQEEEDAEREAEDERRRRARRAEQEAKQRRTAMVYLSLGPIVAFIGIVCAVGLSSKIAGLAKGARTVSAAELLEAKDPNSISAPAIAYTPDQPMIETNLGVETKRRRGASTKTRFVLVPVKDKWLIAEREMDAKGSRLEGTLGKWDSGLALESVEKIKAQYPDKRDKFLPVQLDTTGGDAGTTAVIMSVALGVLILLGLGSTAYGFVSLPRRRRR